MKKPLNLIVIGLLITLTITGCNYTNENTELTSDHSDTFKMLTVDDDIKNIESTEDTEEFDIEHISIENGQKVPPSDSTRSIVEEMTRQSQLKNETTEQSVIDESVESPEDEPEEYFEYIDINSYTLSDFTIEETQKLPYDIGSIIAIQENLGSVLCKGLLKFCEKNNLNIETTKITEEAPSKVYKNYTSEVYNISNKNILVVYNENACYIKILE